jgi:Protein of unknown function (DUF1569)
MPLLHDPAVRDSIRSRVTQLTPSSDRRWGTMSVDQMLWHCNQVLGTALGDVKVGLLPIPFPLPVIKFLLLSMPWMRGAFTAPEYRAVDQHEFETEKAKCLALIDRFTQCDIARADWPRAAFGEISGRDWSRLQAKHLNHHLKQFSS